ncbi:hypothetical protein ACLOJK_029492 [Asimina triloba]
MDLLLLILQALALFLLSILLYNLWSSKAKLEKTNSPPEPPGAWPVIGHLNLLGGREPVARILGAMADKCGPMFMLRLGVRQVLVVSSWELARECFTTNDKVLATRPSNLAGKIMGYDYTMLGFAPYGSYWREIRKRMTLEVLSSRRLDSLKHTWKEEIDICIRDIYEMWVKNGKQPVDVEMKPWFADLTLNVMMMVIVGKRYVGRKVAGDQDEARRFHHEISELFRLMGVFVAGDALPFIRWMDVEGHEKAMKRTAKELDMLASKWLEEHRERRAKRRKATGRKDDEDFMDVLDSIMGDEEMEGHNPDSVIKATILYSRIHSVEMGPRALITLAGISRPFRCRGHRHCFTGGLNKQSVLLDPPLLNFLYGNMVDNDFIEFTNEARKVKVEFLCELKVPYALDEGKHLYLCEKACEFDESDGEQPCSDHIVREASLFTLKLGTLYFSKGSEMSDHLSWMIWGTLWLSTRSNLGLLCSLFTMLPMIYAVDRVAARSGMIVGFKKENRPISPSPICKGSVEMELPNSIDVVDGEEDNLLANGF